MSSFNNLVRDFPSRCGEVLELTYEVAEANNREVTLLLMTAAAFLFPYERMQSKHPSRDRPKFPDLGERFNVVLGGRFKESPFYKAAPNSWFVGRMSRPDVAPDIYETPTDNTTTSQVLSTIRNAIAHANVWATASEGIDRPIDALVFTSEDRKKELEGKKEVEFEWKYVRLTPDAFRTFLVTWLSFLQDEDIAEVAHALDELPEIDDYQLGSAQPSGKLGGDGSDD